MGKPAPQRKKPVLTLKDRIQRFGNRRVKAANAVPEPYIPSVAHAELVAVNNRKRMFKRIQELREELQNTNNPIKKFEELQTEIENLKRIIHRPVEEESTLLSARYAMDQMHIWDLGTRKKIYAAVRQMAQRAKQVTDLNLPLETAKGIGENLRDRLTKILGPIKGKQFVSIFAEKKTKWNRISERLRKYNL